MPFDKRMINEFLEDFAGNIIITDKDYSAQGLYDLTNFQNRIDQLNFDDIHDNFQKQYSIGMNDKVIFRLEDEDLVISYSGSLTQTDLPNI